MNKIGNWKICISFQSSFKSCLTSKSRKYSNQAAAIAVAASRLVHARMLSLTKLILFCLISAGIVPS